MKKTGRQVRFRFLMILVFVISAGTQWDTGHAMVDSAIVFVEVPVAASRQGGEMAGMLSDYTDGCRIMSVALSDKGHDLTCLTKAFISARDPSVSFDGTSILFSGKRHAGDSWQIYRMDRDGGNVRQLTADTGDRVSPLHVGALFYLNDTHPVGQMIFQSPDAGAGGGPALFACNDDGKMPRRISHNLYPDVEPDVLPNGRLVFSSSGSRSAGNGLRAVLMAVNIDGTDLMPFTGDQAPEFHHRMPRVGFDDRVYYIEADSLAFLSGGNIASVSRFRSLHSRKLLTRGESFQFHSPCPMPGGELLVSCRDKGGSSPYRLVRIRDFDSTRVETIVSSPGYHCLDAHPLTSRPTARGRSSVVGFKYKDSGVFFCMDVYMTDRPEYKGIKPGSVHDVLVLRGVPEASGDPDNPYGQVLGSAPVYPDGSFHVRVPSETPLTFLLRDKDGTVLAQQRSWTWVMHGENRGCIGCHEDRELSPPNRFIDAVRKLPENLAAPSGGKQ